MKRVYLDQNKWIDLARSHTGHAAGGRFDDILTLLRGSVELGVASFPLSAVHYMEVWNTNSARRRLDLGSLMLELSRGHTIAPAGAILPGELDRALESYFDRTIDIRPLNVFGNSLGHALNVDDKLPQIEIPEGFEIPADDRESLQQLLNDVLKDLALIGPRVDLDKADIDVRYRDVSDRYAKGAQIIRDGAADLSPPRRDDVAEAREYISMIDALNDAFARAGISADALLMQGHPALSEFLQLIPTRSVGFELEKRRLRDSNLPIESGDLADIASLVVAVPYCDVVATEKRWAHLLNSSGLPERFGTSVLHDLVSLGPQLVSS